MIIHVSGSVEDYTINSEVSPKINSYGPFPKSGQDACAIFYPEKMRVIMRYKQSKELMDWNFDDQTAKYTHEDTWDNYQNIRQYGPCATSSTGKLFLYSGDLDSKNNFLGQLKESNVIRTFFHLTHQSSGKGSKGKQLPF